MNTVIHQINQVDLKKIDYNGPFDIDDIGKFTYITYDGKPFVIQTPTMFSGESSGPSDGIIMVPLIGKTKRTTCMMNNFFDALDKKFVRDIEKNAKALGLTNEYKYNSIVNIHSISKKRYVVFRLVNKNNFETAVFDESKTIIPQEDYGKAFESCKFIRLIFEIASLFVNHTKKSIHVALKVYQVEITDLKQMRIVNPIREYAFVDSDSQSKMHDLIKNEMDICGIIDTNDLNVFSLKNNVTVPKTSTQIQKNNQPPKKPDSSVPRSERESRCPVDQIIKRVFDSESNKTSHSPINREQNKPIKADTESDGELSELNELDNLTVLTENDEISHDDE